MYDKAITPYLPPSFDFWLGTDAYGHSVAERLIASTWETVYLVVFAVSVAGAIGVSLGALLAFSKRDWLRSFCEILLGFSYATPLLLLFLLIIVVFGDRLWVFPSVGFFTWGSIALATSTSLERVINSGYIQSSVNFGISPFIAFIKHGMPHALPTIISACVALAVQVFQLLVLLSFIGVGKGGLGSLIREGYQLYPSAWWIWMPTIIVAAVLLGLFALIGHGRRSNGQF